VPSVEHAVKLYFKALAGETGVRAKPLPHERWPFASPQLFISHGELK
jgi:hypothetical protein